MISDYWNGLGNIFRIGKEILIANSPEQALRYIREVDEDRRSQMAEQARKRVLARHTAAHRAAELEPHKNGEIVVHCHHGGRSLRVVNWLRQQGYAHAINMAGGIDQWSQVIDPSVPRY